MEVATGDGIPRWVTDEVYLRRAGGVNPLIELFRHDTNQRTNFPRSPQNLQHTKFIRAVRFEFFRCPRWDADGPVDPGWLWIHRNPADGKL